MSSTFGKPRRITHNVGDEFVANSGSRFIIVEILNPQYSVVKSIDTGYVTTVYNGNARAGKIKDPLYPTVEGVGFIGIGDHKPYYKSRVKNPAYALWCAVLRRVYNPKAWKRGPSYKGCTVCERWHNFQLFAEDLKDLEGYNEWVADEPGVRSKSYALDKDLKKKGNKVYSPEFCMFITTELNSKHTSKTYKEI